MATFRCVIHGSFRRHFDEIQRVRRLFTEAGIQVIAPAASDIKTVENGFAFLASDQSTDPREVEALYLEHLSRLGPDGFSYFINPDGVLGTTASYELGIVQARGIRAFFSHLLIDPPAVVSVGAVWEPDALVEYLQQHGHLPE